MISTWTWVSMKPGTTMRPRDVDLARAVVVVVGPDDAVAADRDVAGRDLARDEVEEPGRLDDEIGRRLDRGPGR